MIFPLDIEKWYVELGLGFIDRVSGPNLVTHLFEGCVVRCGSQNKHQKVTFLNHTGLYAQNLLFILDSIVNTIWMGVI